MPEEEVKGKDEAQQTVDVPAPADKTKSVVMILIALSVLVMICTPIVTVFAMKAMIASQNPADAKNAKKFDEYGEFPIKGHKAVIKDTNGTRYVSVDIVIQYSEPAKMDNFFKEKSADNRDGRLNEIKDAVTKILMSKQLDELSSPTALKNLSEEIKEAIKNILPKDAKGTVTGVLFPNFLIS